MSKNKALSLDYFDRHPKSDECHITSDGRVFHQEGAASSYAATLADNTVEVFNREGKKVEDIEVDETSVDETPENETPENETPENETPENETGITLADFDAETTTYEQGKALIAELGLKARSNKKVDIFAVLTAAKEAAQN